nr:PTS sugar transporter subunit IIA [Pelosinus baikalensis]
MVGRYVQRGCVEEAYVEAAVQMVGEVGPFVVIYPGLAVCYASSHCGVKEIGMSLITLERSVYFGNRFNDPVKTLICLAAKDDISYIKTLELVVKKIQDGSIDEIANAEEIDEIIKLIH